MQSPNDVLIIEDHPLVAHATKELINRAAPSTTITIYATASEAIMILDSDSRCWHRILLDLDVPGAYGLSLAAEIRKRRLEGVTCVLTALDRRADYVADIRAMGFIGYVVKGNSVAQLLVALNAVFRGEPAFPKTNNSFAEKADSLRITNGRIIAPQTIGPGKAQAIAAFLERQQADAADSAAMGDDVSDIPMLEAVGLPIVIVGDPVLGAEASRRGWRTIVLNPVQAAA